MHATGRLHVPRRRVGDRPRGEREAAGNGREWRAGEQRASGGSGSHGAAGSANSHVRRWLHGELSRVRNQAELSGPNTTCRRASYRRAAVRESESNGDTGQLRWHANCRSVVHVAVVLHGSRFAVPVARVLVRVYWLRTVGGQHYRMADHQHRAGVRRKDRPPRDLDGMLRPAGSAGAEERRPKNVSRQRILARLQIPTRFDRKVSRWIPRTRTALARLARRGDGPRRLHVVRLPSARDREEGGGALRAVGARV